MPVIVLGHLVQKRTKVFLLLMPMKVSGLLVHGELQKQQPFLKQLKQQSKQPQIQPQLIQAK